MMQRTCQASFLAIAVLVGLIGNVCAADETFDLRGPAPKKGQSFKDTMKFSMKDAEVSIGLGDVKLEGKMDMTSIAEKEEEILGVDGRNITKLRTKLLKDDTTTKMAFAGMMQNDTKKKSLVGEIIFSELKDGKWKHVLEDTKPSDEQAKELKNFDNPENDDELFPAEKVKVGHAWDIEAKAFKKLFGSRVTDAKGTGKGKFLRTEKIGDDLCAVIEMDIDLKAKMKEDENEFDVEMKGKIISFRSIADGLDVKFSINGTAKFDGTVNEDGMKAKLVFSGKMAGEGTAHFKKK